MTDTSPTLLSLLEKTEVALQHELDALLARSKDSPDKKDSPERWAKDISALMKTMAETAAQKAAEEAKTTAKTHTRYEDMPPPTPEDEARFNDRFRQLVGSIIDARGKV